MRTMIAGASDGRGAGMRRSGHVVRGAALALLGLTQMFAPGRIGAQERDSIPGVTLGLLYESAYRPTVGIKPFTGRFGGDALAPRVEAIIGRDVRYSDRFETLESIPEALAGEGIDYTLWDRLNTDWIVSGQVEGSGDGFVLLLELHDVVFREVKERGRFPIPDEADDDFRMAVHRVSDAIVEWITGEPGMAASRVAFSMQGPGTAWEIYVIDSDGENLRRVTNYANTSLSPAWSPDGTRLAFTSYKEDDTPRVFEVDLGTGRERALAVTREGQYMTPSYHPDGQLMAFSVMNGPRSGLFTYNFDRDCCLTHLTGGSWDDISPAFSADGRWIAYTTNRFGEYTPQIQIIPSRGGTSETLSPYEYGANSYYADPDWSPTQEMVAFHGRIRRGRYQILVADLADRGHRLRQVTWEGNNEAPSWAPDGRHLVFAGERDWGFGLMIVDVATGKIRSLIGGRRVDVPDWSPALRPAS
ncbi:MAG: hypothetical protein OEZ65_09335 [Gemmatimonadota bacterium]|nr:hypothetical protein [Gemmatimonadota bacterium]